MHYLRSIGKRDHAFFLAYLVTIHSLIIPLPVIEDAVNIKSVSFQNCIKRYHLCVNT